MQGTFVAEVDADDASTVVAAMLDARRRTSQRSLLQSTRTRYITPYDMYGGDKHTRQRRLRTMRQAEKKRPRSRRRTHGGGVM